MHGERMLQQQIAARLSRPTASAGLIARLVLVTLFWGGSFIAARELALSMPHFVAAAGRYVIATAALFVFLRLREGRLPRPTARQWLWIALLGATGVFAFNALYFAAMERITAGRASLIIATVPALTALAAWRFFGLRFAWWQWAGVAVALGGVAIVISHGDVARLIHDGIGAGDALMLGGALLMVVYTLVGRAMVRGPGALSPLATTAYAAALGLLPLAALAVRELMQAPALELDWGEVAVIAYLGLPGTALAYVWFYEGVKEMGAARASVFGNLVPVFGVALAGLLLGEPLLASMVAGGLVTLAGVSLTNLERG